MTRKQFNNAAEGSRNGGPMQRLVRSVSVLALVAASTTRPAEAKVAYTSTNVTVSGNGFFTIDLNHDGVTDVSVVSSGRSVFCTTGPGSSGSVYALPNAGAETVANGNFVLALVSGAGIGPKRSYYLSEGLMLQYSSCLYPPHTNLGAWQNVTNRYLGIRFQVNGHVHYGWARLSLKEGKVGPVVTLTGYAYETIAGQRITAGVTSGP
jgi:hypothetical protein